MGQNLIDKHNTDNNTILVTQSPEKIAFISESLLQIALLEERLKASSESVNTWQQLTAFYE